MMVRRIYRLKKITDDEYRRNRKDSKRRRYCEDHKSVKMPLVRPYKKKGRQ